MNLTKTVFCPHCETLISLENAPSKETLAAADCPRCSGFFYIFCKKVSDPRSPIDIETYLSLTEDERDEFFEVNADMTATYKLSEAMLVKTYTTFIFEQMKLSPDWAIINGFKRRIDLECKIFDVHPDPQKIKAIEELKYKWMAKHPFQEWKKQFVSPKLKVIK